MEGIRLLLLMYFYKAQEGFTEWAQPYLTMNNYIYIYVYIYLLNAVWLPPLPPPPPPVAVVQHTFTHKLYAKEHD
jgi:hypothetical protein